MKELQNKPGVTIALIVILIGAIAVTVLRIKGNTAVAGGRAVAQEQSAEQRKHSLPDDNVPPQRDPFGHPILYANPPLNGAHTEPPPDLHLPPNDDLPVLPLKIRETEPGNAQASPLPSVAHDSEAKQAADNPASESGLKLQAIVSGDTPLAVIKDGSGKTHFVYEGDQICDGIVVARIINGTVAVRHGGSFSILSLERGSGGNEQTQ